MSDPAKDHLSEEQKASEEKQVSSEAENVPNSPVDFGYILGRAKAVLTDPKGVWSEIKEEALAPKELYLKYVLFLAAIPPLAMYVGMVVFGVSVPFTNMTFRWPIIGGIATMLVQYTMSLVSIGVIAFVIQKLGPTFKATPSFESALRLVAFSMTPAYVGGILGILPMLSILGIVFSIYGLYVLYCGFQPMTEVPEEGALKYFGASVVLSFVALFVLSLIATVLSPVGMNPAAAQFGDRSIATTADGSPAKVELPGGISIDMKKLEDSVKELEKMAPQEDR